jgi:hypothetical protein
MPHTLVAECRIHWQVVGVGRLRFRASVAASASVLAHASALTVTWARNARLLAQVFCGRGGSVLWMQRRQFLVHAPLQRAQLDVC